MKERAVSVVVLMLLLTSMLTSIFIIQPVKAEPGTVYIRADGSVDPPTAPIQREGDETFYIYTLTGDIYGSLLIERDEAEVHGDGHQIIGTGSGVGIYLEGRFMVSIVGFIVRNAAYGIFLWKCDEIFVGDSDFSHNENGIWMQNCTNCGISMSTVSNTQQPLTLWYCNGSGIDSNIVSDNNNGITLQYSSVNSFVSNTISSNAGTHGGISLYHSSNQNLIIRNNISNNYYSGVWIWESSGNWICNNNFVDNYQQAVDYGTDNWNANYPRGGNYWNDYAGVDNYSGSDQDQLGSDRIGDTARSIPGSGTNRDLYPLMNPFALVSWSWMEFVSCNLDDNYGTIEGGGEVFGYVELSDIGLSIECQLFYWPKPAETPRIYLIATNGVDIELAKQEVGPPDVTWYDDTFSYSWFSGYIMNVIRPLNGGHYELELLITYEAQEYDLFVQTTSWINSHYFPLTTLPVRPHKFDVGDRVRTTASLRVREGPGLDSNIISIMPEGTLGQIMAGPVEADGYTWWDVNYDAGIRGWSAENWLEKSGQDQPPNCQIRLQKDGADISQVEVGEFLDIYVGDSTDDAGIRQVRFSNDDILDGSPTGGWTEWYDWQTSSDDWDATSKIRRWAFYTPGNKEVWAEVCDSKGQMGGSYAEMYVPGSQSPTCVVRLKTDGAEATEIDLGKSLDIYVGESCDDLAIVEVCFSSDDSQDGTPTGGWTNWCDWSRSSEGWSAYSKTREWAFGTPGKKEVWAMVKDSDGNVEWNKANIFVNPGYAIIVAGQDFTKQKWAIDQSANNAYRALHNLGFDDNHIFYLNTGQQQIDGHDVVDWFSCIENLQYSLDEIKRKIGDNSSPQFVLYFVGHGIEEVFDFYTDSDPLSSAALREMLAPFPENRMLIVLGSCYSGSFITRLVEGDTYSVSGNNRIVITACHDNEETPKSVWGLGGWYHSSDRFWGNLNNGLNVKEAFTSGTSLSECNHLWLDDNGDYKGSPPDWWVGSDGVLASATKIGVPSSDDLKFAAWNMVHIGSAGELRVYDSENRVTGLVNGNIEENIPYSIYDEEYQIAAIFLPSGTYRYEVVGTQIGSFELDIALIEGSEANVFTAINIPITTGMTQQYTVDWDVLSEGEEGVVVGVDSDGDGVFEHAFTSDRELTQIEYVISTDDTPSQTWINIGEPEYVVNEITYMTSASPVELIAEDDLGGSGVASTGYRIYNATYDSGWMVYAEPFYLVGLGDGAYRIDYNSTDVAGNVELTNTVTVILDNTEPLITVENPPAGWALQDGVTFIISAIDASEVSSVNISIREADGGEGTPVGFEDLPAVYDATTGKWTVFFDTLQLPDGYYIVLVEAMDNLGHANSISVDYSIRNWAVLELLPASEDNKAGRTMPVKFALRVAASVDPNQPFVYNEDLTIKIYATKDPNNILQTSTFGDTAQDYRINTLSELYITNFQTLKTPMQYAVTIRRDTFLVGSFEFRTVK